jgi:tetratricopeptide (TPR) repeat protein
MHAMKGNFVEAYKLIEDAISLGRETGFWDVLAELLTGKGTILQLDKKFEEAEDCFLQALQIYRETDAEESAMSVNFELARLYIDMGRKNEAKAILEEVLAYYTKLNIKSMIEKINKELELLSKTNP